MPGARAAVFSLSLSLSFGAAFPFADERMGRAGVTSPLSENEGELCLRARSVAALCGRPVAACVAWVPAIFEGPAESCTLGSRSSTTMRSSSIVLRLEVNWDSDGKLQKLTDVNILTKI